MAVHNSVILMKLAPAAGGSAAAALDAVNECRAKLRTAEICEEIAFLLTFGEFDFVMIVRTPDTESAAFCSFALSDTGFVTTQTLCGFSAEEVGAAVFELRRQRGWDASEPA
jgi:uncharacterized protein with GYD domain